MKVLVISQYFYPEQFRVNDIVSELVKRDHKVTVLTGLPNYPEGNIFPGYETAYKEVSDYNGAAVYRCKLRPRYKGIKNLALNYLSFILEAKKTIKKIKPDFDVIYVYEPSPVTVAIPAIWYKKKYGTPIYYYCMDLWPESVRDTNNALKRLNTHHPIYLVAKAISRYVYDNVTLIGNKCDAFCDYIHDVCKIDKNKMVVLYEHAEDSYLSIDETPIDNGIIDFMFLGNIGTVQNCDLWVEAFSQIDYKGKAKLHFVGDGSFLNALKQMVTDKGLTEDVIFHGRHPIEEINQFYNLADVCLISLSGDTACGMTPPGKLYGYMAASRPVLGLISGEAKSLIDNANCGWCVVPNECSGLISMMQSIINGDYDLKKAGQNGRSFFMNNFTKEMHIKNLEEQLSSLCKQ